MEEASCFVEKLAPPEESTGNCSNFVIQEGVFLRGIVDDLSIHKAEFEDTALNINLHVIGTASIFIESIP